MKLLCGIADSFIYVVSRMGVTGATGSLSADLPQLCGRVHEYSGNVPIAVGFGVSTREHFLSVGKIAEGVVIGSQIINVLAAAGEGGAAKREAVRAYCAEVTGKEQNGKASEEEVNITEKLAAATLDGEGNPDETITREAGPGLMDEIVALNTEFGEKHPEVRKTWPLTYDRNSQMSRSFPHVSESLEASTSQSHLWTACANLKLDSTRPTTTLPSGRSIVHITSTWAAPVTCTLRTT